MKTCGKRLLTSESVRNRPGTESSAKISQCHIGCVSISYYMLFSRFRVCGVFTQNILNKVRMHTRNRLLFEGAVGGGENDPERSWKMKK